MGLSAFCLCHCVHDAVLQSCSKKLIDTNLVTIIEYYGGKQKRRSRHVSQKKSKDSKKKLSKKQMKKLEKKRVSKRDNAATCKVDKKREKAIRKAAKKLGKSLSSYSDAKGSKALKKGKTAKKGQQPAGAASCSASSFKLDLGTCPCCSKRCPLSKPKCGKGRAVARKKRERLMGEAVA